MQVRLRRHLLAVVLGGAFCTLNPTMALAQQPAGSAPQPALFNTKAEAEAAAKTFHCTGAHLMGRQWMPCAGHGGASHGSGSSGSSGSGSSGSSGSGHGTSTSGGH
ncbi:MAG: hypothetical protein NTY67_14090 [Cyanobacteria bacterium]|nr:hypothetical protein [Cyanobacteriota bacterium]